jgi:HEAT repeat protein
VTTSRIATAGLIAAVLLLIGCGGPPPVPPEIAKARQTLSEGWDQGGTLSVVQLTLYAQHPGLEAARPHIEAALDSPSPALTMEAVRTLAAWEDDSAVPLLKPLLEADSEALRLTAARALAQLGDASGQQVLEGAIRSSDGTLRPDVCGALANLEPNACVEQAEEDLTAKDDAKQSSAAAALAANGGEEAVSVLREGLKKVRGNDRAFVIEALAEVGDASDIERIEPYVKFRENAVAVIQALGRLGSPEAEPVLRPYLAMEDKPAARVEAAVSLAQIGITEQTVIDTLQEGALSDERGIRYRVASSLRGVGGEEVATVLAGLAGDPNPGVRKAAVTSLLGRDSPVALQGAQLAWDAGKEAQEGASYEAALTALRVAAKVGGEDAEAMLEEALNSPNWAYALQAAMGLLELAPASPDESAA